MDYQRIYDQIISRAQFSERKKVKGGTYYEKHHIIPRCLGGSNEKSNLVLLTAREHFICHKLLVEIYPENKKILYAAWMLYIKTGSDRHYVVSSKEYERHKIEVAKIMSINALLRISQGIHPTLGKHPSLQTLQKKSASMKGLLSGENNPCYGKYGVDHPAFGSIKSESAKELIRKKNIGKIVSIDTCLKISVTKQGIRNPNFGKLGNEASAFGNKHSIQSSDKMRLAWTKREPIICPHCGFIGRSRSNMNRHHFDNCKTLK